MMSDEILLLMIFGFTEILLDERLPETSRQLKEKKVLSKFEIHSAFSSLTKNLFILPPPTGYHDSSFSLLYDTMMINKENKCWLDFFNSDKHRPFFSFSSILIWSCSFFFLTCSLLL